MEKAVQGVFGGFDDRFATDVEGGVNDDGAACHVGAILLYVAGTLLKGFQEIVVARVLVSADRLYARGAIDVGDGGDLCALIGEGICNKEHVRALTVQLKPLGNLFFEYRRGEWAEGLGWGLVLLGWLERAENGFQLDSFSYSAHTQYRKGRIKNIRNIITKSMVTRLDKKSYETIAVFLNSAMREAIAKKEEAQAEIQALSAMLSRNYNARNVPKGLRGNGRLSQRRRARDHR